MASEKMSCLICDDKEGAMSKLNLFEGSGLAKVDSSTQAVANDLSAIFVVRNMLGISSEYCEYLIFSNGNPSSWGLSFCSICRRIIQEAQFISERIRNLVDEFEGLSKKLKEVAVSSFEDSTLGAKINKRSREWKGGTSEEIRRWVYDYSKGKGRHAVSGDGTKNNENIPKELKVPADPTELNTSDDDPLYISEIENIEMDFKIDDEYVDETGDGDGEDDDDIGDSLAVDGCIFPCPVGCGKDFETEFLAKVHVKRHHEGDPNPYECEICGAKFARPSVLEKHTSLKHNKDLKFPCPRKCGKDFETEFLAKVHDRRHHEGDRSPYECEICNRKFSRPCMLDQHTRQIHRKGIKFIPSKPPVKKQNDRPLYECNVCGEKFVRLDRLERHKARRHNKALQFPCPINCGRDFETEFLATIHFRRHHEGDPNPYECELCGDKFQRPSTLEKHKSRRHSEAQQNFPCSANCGKIFQTELLAKVHFKRYHEGDRNPYECEICSAKFARPCLLEKHTQKRHQISKRQVPNNCADTVQEMVIGNVVTIAEMGSDIEMEGIDVTPEDEETPERNSRPRLPRVTIKRESNDQSDSDQDGFNEPDIHCPMSPDSPEWKPDSSDNEDEEDREAQKIKKTELSLGKSAEPRKGLLKDKRDRVIKRSKYDIKCPECVSTFPVQYLLDAHILRRHYGELTPYPCDLCDKRFPTMSRLLVHKRRWHLTPSTSVPTNKDESVNFEVFVDQVNGESCKKGENPNGSVISEVNNVELNEKMNTPELELEIKNGKKSAEIVTNASSTVKLNENLELLEAMDESHKIQCDQCRFSTKSKLHLIGHINSAHLGMKKGFKCPALKCNKTFKTYGEVFEHCQRHIAKSTYLNRLNCTYSGCKKTFNSEIFMNAHTQSVHLGVKQAYKCSKCPRGFVYSTALYTHMKMMHNYVVEELLKNPNTPGPGEHLKDEKANSTVKLPLVFKCSKCQLRFPSKLSVEAHLRRIHFDIKSAVRCPHLQCKQQKFLSDQHLKKHILRYHTEKRERGPKQTVMCDFCDKKLSGPAALLIHRKMHTKEKDFMCEICSRTFTLARYLEYHQKSVHYNDLGLTPLKCNYCDRILNNPKSLETHINLVHEKKFKFKCPTCPIGFMSETQMVEHIRIHTGEKPLKCPHCPKTFPKQLYLNNHLRVHTGEKPWKCTVCQKAFSDKPTYNRHMETHGDAVHNCSVCNKQFKVWHTYRLHMKKHRIDVVYASKAATTDNEQPTESKQPDTTPEAGTVIPESEPDPNAQPTALTTLSDSHAEVPQPEDNDFPTLICASIFY